MSPLFLLLQFINILQAACNERTEKLNKIKCFLNKLADILFLIRKSTNFVNSALQTFHELCKWLFCDA